MKAGLFITFEGVEGAGKSTQIALAVEELMRRGYQVRVTREPGGEALAERIRSLILDNVDGAPVDRAELFLLQAARAQHVEKVIRPCLEAGQTVVCDRFYDSTIAYQVHARGLDEAFVRSAIEFAVGGVHPDLTIVLDLAADDGLKRQTQRNRMEDEALAFHQAVREGFLEQARLEPERVKLVDASGGVEEVHGRVMAALAPILTRL